MPLFKFISHIETTTTEAGEVYECKPLSTSSDLSILTPLSDEEHEEENITKSAVTTVNKKDVGLWPSKISKDTQIFLVCQGASVVQSLDSDFGEAICQCVSTKRQTRKLTCECFFFFQILPISKNVDHGWCTVLSMKLFAAFVANCFQIDITQHSEDAFNIWWKLNARITKHEYSANSQLKFHAVEGCWN